MSKPFRFPNAIKRDPAIGIWMQEHVGEMGAIARRWFEIMHNTVSTPGRRCLWQLARRSVAPGARGCALVWHSGEWFSGLVR